MLSASFLFTDTATTEIYTLSLHDALPIFQVRASRVRGVPRRGRQGPRCPRAEARRTEAHPGSGARAAGDGRRRSEEHTSELQSRTDLVCRLLLEKKKTKQQQTQLTLNDAV